MRFLFLDFLVMFATVSVIVITPLVVFGLIFGDKLGFVTGILFDVFVVIPVVAYLSCASDYIKGSGSPKSL